VSLALFSASSVLITSECSAEISTPMYCAAWLRADSSADCWPSSSDEAPSFAPEKKSASEELVVFVIQAGCLTDDEVLTAGFSPPQAARSSAAQSSLLRTDVPRAGLRGQLLGVVLQPLDVVQLVQHVLVVGEAVGLVDHV